MNAKTVKLALLRELVEAGSVRSAAIIGLPGGLCRPGAHFRQNRCCCKNIARFGRS